MEDKTTLSVGSEKSTYSNSRGRLAREFWNYWGHLSESDDLEEAFDSYTDRPFFKKIEEYRVGEDEKRESETFGSSREEDFTQVGFTGVQESWNDVQNLDARILEVRPGSVKLEVLEDREERSFQDRIFSRDLLEGSVRLEKGNYILVRIFKGEGKIKFTFQDGGKIADKEAFEDTSRFQDLDDIDFDKEL